MINLFNTYHHMVVMLVSVVSSYHSLRKVISGLLSNARTSYLILVYPIWLPAVPLSDTNARRKGSVFVGFI